jgi:hypothetical protein
MDIRPHLLLRLLGTALTAPTPTPVYAWRRVWWAGVEEQSGTVSLNKPATDCPVHAASCCLTDPFLWAWGVGRRKHQSGKSTICNMDGWYHC